MQGARPPIPPFGTVVELPTSPRRLPDPPAYFGDSGDAYDCWAETVGRMIAKNLYDEDVRQMVEAYCVQYARWREAMRKVEEEGEVVEGHRGLPRINPWAELATQAYDRLVKLAKELGLTPAARKHAVKVRGATLSAASKFLKGA